MQNVKLNLIFSCCSLLNFIMNLEMFEGDFLVSLFYEDLCELVLSYV